MNVPVLSGWGATTPTRAEVVRPATVRELEEAVPGRGVSAGLIGRGLGRSYGDAAQSAGGRVIDATALTGISWLRPGVVRVAAGTSLDALLRWSVPQGWFVAVSPGTRMVTIGGSIAADVHGKSHHRHGSFGRHVERIGLRLASGETVDIGPTRDPELFWATTGGMGLTGVIVDADLHLVPVETSRLLVDTDRCADLEAVMGLMDQGDERYTYSVAWIDLMAGGHQLGRSVLTRGDFATPADLGADSSDDPLSYDPAPLLRAPAVVPSGLLNRSTVGAFNELWFRRAPRSRRGEVQSIAWFFHPLDAVDGWNRCYGRRGFLQWQPVVPLGAETVVHADRRRAGRPRRTHLLLRAQALRTGRSRAPLVSAAGVDARPRHPDPSRLRCNRAGDPARPARRHGRRRGWTGVPGQGQPPAAGAPAPDVPAPRRVGGRARARRSRGTHAE